MNSTWTIIRPSCRWRRRRRRRRRRRAAAALVVVDELEHDGEDDDEDEDEQDDDGDAGPLAGALLMLPRHHQLLAAAVDEGARAADMGLDVVELLPLRRHQHGHVVEHLVELEQRAFQLRHGAVPLLDLGDHAEHLAAALLGDRALQEPLPFPGLGEVVERRLVGLLAGDGVVPPRHGLPVLGGDAGAEGGEGFHGVAELLAEAGDDGGAGAVGGGARAAPGDGAVGGVGAVERLEAELHHLGLLDGGGDVGVHARPQRAHRRRVVQRLAPLVGVVERPLDPLQVAELVLDRLHVLEEPIKARPRRRPRRRRHLHAAARFNIPVAAAAAAAALARSLLLSPSPRRRGAVLRAQLCVYRLMPIGSPR